VKPTRPPAAPPSALILAIEPDKKQAAKIAKLARELPDTEWVIEDSAQRALQVLGQRVPNLILTSLLLSPRDEAALTDRLRELETAASHVQTLVIPVLGTASRARGGSARGLLKRLTGSKQKPAASPDGCDPAIFAAQIQEYLERAAAEREHAKAAAEEVPPQQVQLYGEAWEVVRAVAPLPPPTVASNEERLTPEPSTTQSAETEVTPYDLVFDQSLQERREPIRKVDQVAESLADRKQTQWERGWDEPAASPGSQSPQTEWTTSIGEVGEVEDVLRVDEASQATGVLPVDEVLQFDEAPVHEDPVVPQTQFAYRPLFSFNRAPDQRPSPDEPLVLRKPVVEERLVRETPVVEEPIALRKPFVEEPIVNDRIAEDTWQTTTPLPVDDRGDDTSILKDAPFTVDSTPENVPLLTVFDNAPSAPEDEDDEAWDPQQAVVAPAPEPAAMSPVTGPEETWSVAELSAFEVVQDEVRDGTDAGQELNDIPEDLDFEALLAREPIDPLVAVPVQPAAATPSSDFMRSLDLDMPPRHVTQDVTPDITLEAATDPWADIVTTPSGRLNPAVEIAVESVIEPLELTASNPEPVRMPERSAYEWQEPLLSQAPEPDLPASYTPAPYTPPPTSPAHDLEALLDELRMGNPPAPAAVAVDPEPIWTAAPPVPAEALRAAVPPVEPEPAWTPRPSAPPLVEAPPPPQAAPALPNLEVLEMLTAIRRDLEQLREERVTQPAPIVEDEPEDEPEVEQDAIEAEPARDADLVEPDDVAPPPPSRPARSRTPAQTKAKAKPKSPAKAAAKGPGKSRRKAPPIQDEWGFFDPDQCGFAALLAKLKEIEDDSPKEED
jgi:hypothetical protein